MSFPYPFPFWIVAEHMYMCWHAPIFTRCLGGTVGVIIIV